MSRALWSTTAIAAVACLACGWLLAGPRGAFLTAVALWVVTLVAARAGVPRAVKAIRTAPRHAQRREGYPTYVTIQRKLDLGYQSPRHFRHVTQPLIRRVAGQLLRDRRRIDIERSADLARAVIGEEGWALVEPGDEPAENGAAPNTSLRQLNSLLDRLEEL
ncbi:MAG: hypothetical protein ACR2KG_02065 [Nocardioidaceae bacterium]